MLLPRRVEDETLDHLAETDPRAVRSRADLRRINRIMGARAILLRALEHALAQGMPAPRRIIEFGAGDGTLMLRLAESLHARWPAVEVTLLDRQRLIESRTLAGFERAGWTVKLLTTDLLDWLAPPSRAVDGRYDLAIANLFLHHFDAPELRRVLHGIAQRCDAFCASEPRRAPLALAASRLTGLIGANDVTRRDAVLSVHAGFAGAELSSQWPSDADWQLQERDAGLFSHVFLASRRECMAEPRGDQ
jgi:hypothetical protein